METAEWHLHCNIKLIECHIIRTKTKCHIKEFREQIPGKHRFITIEKKKRILRIFHQLSLILYSMTWPHLQVLLPVIWKSKNDKKENLSAIDKL